MTFKEAKKLGLECGLTEPYEWVNNVIIHSTQLFSWDKINDEIKELVEDAKKHGVKFCKCGHADRIENDLCYICKRLTN